MQVSHSRIEKFNNCPRAYKLHYIDNVEGYQDIKADTAFIIGTALHEAIETTLDNAIKNYIEQYPIITTAHVNEILKLETAYKECMKKLPELSDAIFEHELNAPDFKGFIDLLVPVKNPTDADYCKGCPCSNAQCTHNIDICKEEIQLFDMYDFKYSNAMERYAQSDQLHIYKYYFELLNPNKRIRNMYFLFAPKSALKLKYKNKTNKADETIQEFRARCKQDQIEKQATLLQIEFDINKVNQFFKDAKTALNATDFPRKESTLCGFCEFKGICEKEDCMQLPKNEKRKAEKTQYKKIWLYGAPFTGKTFLANQFPDALMLNTDGNVKFVDSPYIAIRDEVECTGKLTTRKFAWEVFKDAIKELEKGSEFKTIVVDLVEDTYEQCRLYMFDKLGITHESDDGFRAWDKIKIEFLGLYRRLMNLDYNIVLCSHETTARDITKKTGDKITSIAPNVKEANALKLAGMVDIVARLTHEDNDYFINFKHDEVTFGGGRLNLNCDKIASNYNDICELYDRNNIAKIEPVVEEPAVDAPEGCIVAEVPRPTVETETVKVEDVPFEEAPVEVREMAVEAPADVNAPKFEAPAQNVEEVPVRRRRRVE